MGTISATAIVAVNPGVAPTKVPSTMPKNQGVKI